MRIRRNPKVRSDELNELLGRDPFIQTRGLARPRRKTFMDMPFWPLYDAEIRNIIDEKINVDMYLKHNHLYQKHKEDLIIYRDYPQLITKIVKEMIEIEKAMRQKAIARYMPSELRFPLHDHAPNYPTQPVNPDFYKFALKIENTVQYQEVTDTEWEAIRKQTANIKVRDFPPYLFEKSFNKMWPPGLKKPVRQC